MSADLFAEFSQGNADQIPTTQSTQPLYHGAVSAPAQQYAVHAGSNDKKGYLSGSPSLNSFHSPQQWSSFPAQPSWSSPAAAPQPQNVADEDDGWGDFEVAEPDAPQPSQIEQTYQQPPAQTIAWPGTTTAQTGSMPVTSDRPAGNAAPSFTLPAQARQARGFPENTLSSPSQTALRDTQGTQPLPQPKRRNPVPSQDNDPGVLFDAADFELEDGEFAGESDDEFGDFEAFQQPSTTTKPAPRKEAASARAPPQPSMPSMDLLSLDDPIPAQESRQEPHTSSASGALHFGASIPASSEPKRSSIQDLNWTQFETHAASTKTQKITQPKTQPKGQNKTNVSVPKSANSWATASNDEEWAAWDDEPSLPSTSGRAMDTIPDPSSWDWNSTDTPAQNTTTSSDNTLIQNTATSSDDTAPPVNVPPPSVLLSLFPELLGSGSALFKSTLGLSGSVKEKILSDPKAVQFLQGYLSLATTAARIIAGRKHRWHRDKILAKSMSISAAGSKGMKLAGVDKTQAAREDREAADVVAVWREQVGRLRSVVAAAQAGLRVPELSETLSAHTAKMVGTARKACVVCGLKRDERIAKVDFEVEDSFGEWWVEHWGHRACKNFWLEHEKSLRQR
ncbi:serine/threonine-protein kinase ppk6 [Cordyceps militaris CM01]|uniref:Serine/threonine-protein kinase ppk6 n=1 Tax=Cordyceps militaris (strain CM01) TaxID=983644 RepID=G3J9L5_CORMM|nr:serine/threonine-protein kinase ppk6 [Cordyceps militaris CM01]EGX94141.1 serine/threonine-protein kinase ppk6 [Cordyceps militaris CM01]